MKILYHHRTASKDGQAVHIEEMVGALRALGHEVRVVGPQESGGSMGDDATWVHKLKAVLPKAAYEILELAYTLLAYRRLAAAARDFHPDFIYERYNLFLLAGAMLRRKLGIPLLLEVNSPLFEERQRFSGLGLPRLARWAESRAWRQADFVLPVTRVLAGHVAAAGVPPERIVVIPNGINRAHFAAAPSSEEAKQKLGLSGSLVLGFTGFVRDWHGVDRVIRWMASNDAPVNAVLMVVGDGPVRTELERLAAELNLRDRVRFTGVIDRNRVPAHVAAFDIALQPAVVAYASPLKLFEYLALGKAVIAPRQPNIEEILADDDNALLFDASEPGAFECALTRLCGDAALRARLAVAAAATIDRLDLTWLGNANRVTELATGKSALAGRRISQ
ncbi:MAG: glycosyltransferase family 4 protein [Gammaproteobacteria bacterium]|nr:glycosyltransferase family 4 protein [Rhodocyclaceae bacterium]MBU3910139.1 glycosyltransferase family 4 protein [Gammaproteobacteria bacterium]MBU3990050.1 glycosyltransferase family 4 protein [Gammaproteobacteria bacterium]MBU4006146.1 glycosyltransferase family 4 protein [Gammaproteobacteria bacterium]MBU4022601.1 glycosyltransferase family 4 protein [Gammaproteobacteria bacterium]